MTTVTSALSARAVRLGAPRKVTPRPPSPTPTAPPSWNQPSDCTPARHDVQWLRLRASLPDASHARNERLALAADHRHAPPSSEQVAVRPARVAARAATKRDADPARKPSIDEGASRLASAALGGIPVSLATALPALADDGGGGGGAFGIVALIAVAGAAFVAGQGSGGGGGGGGDDDAYDPPPPTGSQDSKNYAKNLTIASDVKRKGRKPPKPKGL